MDQPILVVDDEQDIINFLSRLLTDNGYRVVTAENGVEALEVLERELPRLILLDLQMPHETGTGLFRKLRKNDRLAQIPVIVISGLAGRNVAVSKDVPVLDKPVDEEQLLQEVQRALGA